MGFNASLRPYRRTGLTLLILLSPVAGWADYSALWGQGGECWTAASRLPDFSQAGYRRGASAIPDLPVRASVKDFGAVGDGVTDDSSAFLTAFQTVAAGAILVPAGRYKITKQLKFSRSGVVLRGAGRDLTTLFFPVPLTTAVGSGSTYAPGGSWSWSGGFLSFEGNNRESPLANIVLPSARGSNVLTVDSTSKLQAGQNVRVVQTDTDGSLGKRLHADQAAATSDLIGHRLIDFPAIIQSVNGNQVQLNRPLRIDVNVNWSPQLHSDDPTVTEVGVEDLALEFPVVPYAGHHVEPGYNGIQFLQIQHAWARRLAIKNADSGVFLSQRSCFITVEDILFSAVPGRVVAGISGHHGLLAADLSQDNLFSGFRFDNLFLHDLSLTSMAAGNVFRQGQGLDLVFDHHRKAPYENLFSDIHVGLGTRLWTNGGDTDAGPPSGARETFWKIRTNTPQSLPPWAIQANVVGMYAQANAAVSSTGNWVETMDPVQLSPSELSASEKARGGRLAAGSGCFAAVDRAPALSVRVFPNPWRKDRHGTRKVSFDAGLVETEVKVFTLSGRLVRKLPQAPSPVLWDLTTEGGKPVASGLYFYLATTPDGAQTRGKLAVLR